MGSPTPTPAPTPTPTPAPTPTPTPTPTDEGGPLDPALNSLQNDSAAAQWDWLASLAELDPYTGLESALGILAACVGADVNPYTNESVAAASGNPFTGERSDNPFTRDEIAGPFARSRDSLLSSPDLLASNGPLPSSSQPMTADQVASVLASDSQKEVVQIDGRSWVQILTTVNGEPTYLFYSDKGPDWYTQRAPGPEVTPSDTPIGPPAPPAASTGGASPTPSAAPVAAPLAASPVSPATPVSQVASVNLPSDPPALSNAVNSPLNDPIAPPGSPPVQVAPPSQIAAPDWTTQTEWSYPRPDSRLIQPITHYDSGNTALNFLANKIVLPWRNLFAFYENIVLATAIGVDDALKRSPDWSPSYQAAQDMLPLEGAMALTMEVGPALDFGINWLSTNQTLGSLGRAPAFWFVGMGSTGGSVPTIPRVAATVRAAEELPMLAPEVKSALSAVTDGPTLPPPSLAEEAATRFQNSVRQAEAFLRANPDAIQQLGGRHTGFPVSPGQLGAAANKPQFARTLAGNAMEGLVDAINFAHPATDAGFRQVGGAYKIDFVGWGRFEGFSFELTTEAGVGAHAGRDYVQAPGAMIFTYTLPLP